MSLRRVTSLIGSPNLWLTLGGLLVAAALLVAYHDAQIAADITMARKTMPVAPAVMPAPVAGSVFADPSLLLKIGLGFLALGVGLMRMRRLDAPARRTAPAGRPSPRADAARSLPQFQPLASQDELSRTEAARRPRRKLSTMIALRNSLAELGEPPVRNRR